MNNVVDGKRTSFYASSMKNNYYIPNGHYKVDSLDGPQKYIITKIESTTLVISHLGVQTSIRQIKTKSSTKDFFLRLVPGITSSSILPSIYKGNVEENPIDCQLDTDDNTRLICSSSSFTDTGIYEIFLNGNVQLLQQG